jgi:hypothetical protein
MPRDGLQQYAPPPGTDGIPNYTVESARYNGFVHDITSDQNNPRPIVAGGTGATTARDAIINLGGEIAQQNVDNYNTFPFVPGSFASDNATGRGAPVDGHFFAGICYAAGPTLIVEARDLSDGTTTGNLYTRKKSGTWGPWVWQGQGGGIGDLELRYVNTIGDTMTGNLTIAAANAALYLQNASGAGRPLRINTGPTPQLDMVNAANTVTTHTFTDAGDFVAKGEIWAGAATTGATYRFSNDSTKYLNYDGVNFQMSGGILNVHNAIMSSGTGGTNGAVWANISQTAGMLCDGTNLVLRGMSNAVMFGNGGGTQTWGYITNSALTVTGIGSFGGNLLVNTPSYPSLVLNDTTAAKARTFRLNPGAGFEMINVANSVATHTFGNDGAFTTAGTGSFNVSGGGGSFLGVGFCGRSGTGGSYGSFYLNLQSNTGAANTAIEFWANNTWLGNLVPSTSDYRVKKDVIDLDSMWDMVKGLRPIKYTHQQFSTPSYVEGVLKEAVKNKEAGAETTAEPPGPMVVTDGIERWGFLAHELQEALIPSAASGVKDDPNDLQVPNPWTVIATLTKALQEAMVRIEALEATR